MKKYHMIDKSDRNAREELNEYTLEELVRFFTINNEDYSNVDAMASVKDIDDLRDELIREAEGMAIHYTFEEV